MTPEAPARRVDRKAARRHAADGVRALLAVLDAADTQPTDTDTAQPAAEACDKAATAAGRIRQAIGADTADPRWGALCARITEARREIAEADAETGSSAALETADALLALALQMAAPPGPAG